jgi:hypothetical protein
MNVILNTEEAHVVLTLVTSQILDHVPDLSEAGREKVRAWRRDHDLGKSDLDHFTEALNAAVGNYIDEHTRRMMRTRGKVKAREA